MIADEMKVDKVQTGKRIKKLMDEKGEKSRVNAKKIE